MKPRLDETLELYTSCCLTDYVAKTIANLNREYILDFCEQMGAWIVPSTQMLLGPGARRAHTRMALPKTVF